MNPGIEQIERSVCACFGIPRDILLSMRRKQIVCEARFALWHLATLNGFKAIQVARFYGKNHTTILNGLERAKELLDCDREFSNKVSSINRYLRR